jgi:hypothetical protein
LTDLDKAHTTAVMAERRLRDSINTINDGFSVFDADKRLVVANSAYLSMFEEGSISPGMPYEDILLQAAEGGLVDIGDQNVQDWVAYMLGRWDTDPITPIDVQFSDGNWAQLVDRRARDGGMVCLSRNITEQMRIWAALEAIPDGFVLYDREDRLLACNQRYRELYPESAEAMVPGTSFEDILRFGLDCGQYADALGREEEWLEERLEMHFDAATVVEQELSGGRWLRVLEQPTPDGGRVGLRVDITHLKEQQAALEVARQAAEAANRAKSAFLANMSHEIRTPMNGVVGMAELLCDTALNDEQRLFAETIKSSGEALLVIINDVLDYSKIEAERLTLHPEPFDLERLIHEVVMLLQPRARERGLDLIIDFDLFLPTRFVGDAGRLRQIFMNLIGNAVKFTEKGHVLIRVVGLETDEGEHQLHLSVEDTGIGIPADQLDHVFGEFNQVEFAQNRKFEGTGLGLAITRRLIERMQGDVWVDSELGKGSVFGFRVCLPVAEDKVLPYLPISVRRALVVDDQFINRTILERQLTTGGMTVALCRSGAEALALLARDAAFDIVLTDEEMPEMDGITLAHHIHDTYPAMPIFLLSANSAALRDIDDSAHLTAILQKPLLRSDLYRRLQVLGAPELLVPKSPPSRPAASRLMRVLAAEDNRTNQLVFRKMVKDLAIDLTFANNGVEAVALYQSIAPDMIFMDISMPEMDGKEATQAIRALEKGTGAHVPIVALTAHAMDGDDQSILASGIDRYMTKPLRRAAISDALVEFCPSGATPVLPETADVA